MVMLGDGRCFWYLNDWEKIQYLQRATVYIGTGIIGDTMELTVLQPSPCGDQASGHKHSLRAGYIGRNLVLTNSKTSRYTPNQIFEQEHTQRNPYHGLQASLLVLSIKRTF